MSLQKVLVIDDDPLLRQTISLVLDELGYDVLEAENGQDGYDLAQAHLPDYIFCDVRMGEMHGYATTQALKENPATAHIPVVLMTGYATDMGRSRGRTVGANYYIAKPFTVKQLINLLKYIENEQGGTQARAVGA